LYRIYEAAGSREPFVTDHRIRSEYLSMPVGWQAASDALSRSVLPGAKQGGDAARQ
jgi:hypothetical protein